MNRENLQSRYWSQISRLGGGLRPANPENNSTAPPCHSECSEESLWLTAERCLAHQVNDRGNCRLYIFD